MKIDYAAPVPKGTETPETAHVLHVGLRMQEPKRDASGAVVIDPLTNTPVMVDVIHECPMRKAHFLALGPATAPYTAAQLAYACECEQWHHQRDKTARAQWDAADKADEEAKFIVRPNGLTEDGKVSITVRHHGLTADLIIPNDVSSQPKSDQPDHRKLDHLVMNGAVFVSS